MENWSYSFILISEIEKSVEGKNLEGILCQNLLSIYGE